MLAEGHLKANAKKPGFTGFGLFAAFRLNSAYSKAPSNTKAAGPVM